MNYNTKLKIVNAPSHLNAEALRPFILTHVVPDFRKWEDDQKIPAEIWTELHALGIWQLCVPSRYGGAGTSALDLISTVRELSYGSAALATAITASFTASLSVFLAAGRELQEEYAQCILSKGEMSAFALTEQEGGSDLTNIQTIAKRVPGGYLLDGDKCFVTNATEARHFVIAARLEDERRTSRGLTLFYVPSSASGLKVRPAHKKLGQRAAKTHPIRLENVFVPTKHRIGGEGDALDISFRALQRSRCMLAAGALGLCLRAGDLAKSYLSRRKSLRKPLLSQPVIRGGLASVHTQMEAAWELTCAAARDWDYDAASLYRVNMAKLFAAQTANRFVCSVMEMFGGWGYTDSHEIEQLLRDVKFYEFVEGPAFVQEILIAKELFPPAVAPAADTLISAA